jgi:ATP-dependent DNA helicase
MLARSLILCPLSSCYRMGQTLPVAVYRLLTVNSVDIEMMEKQVSKKKLDRMTIAGGDFRKAGRRSRGEINVEHLGTLLQNDIKDLNTKGGDVEDIKISDEEFDMIMDRKRLFCTDADKVPTEGKMYDILDAVGGDIIGKLE